MPTASTGSYTFLVTQENGGCESGFFGVTVNVTALT